MKEKLEMAHGKVDLRLKKVLIPNKKSLAKRNGVFLIVYKQICQFLITPPPTPSISNKCTSLFWGTVHKIDGTWRKAHLRKQITTKKWCPKLLMCWPKSLDSSLIAVFNFWWNIWLPMKRVQENLQVQTFNVYMLVHMEYQGFSSVIWWQ